MTGQPGGPRRRIASLDEARSLDDGIVLLEADWGGQTLVVARAEVLRCDEATVLDLLAELGALTCPEDNLQGTRLSFGVAGVGTRVGGGMGGGLVTDDVWCHDELVQAGVEAGVRSVLAGERRRLPDADPAVDQQQLAAILAAYQRRAPALGIDFGWSSPESWSTISGDEIRRQRQLELPARPDGQQWWGATLRCVVSQAGFKPWIARYSGADDRWDDSWQDPSRQGAGGRSPG